MGKYDKYLVPTSSAPVAMGGQTPGGKYDKYLSGLPQTPGAGAEQVAAEQTPTESNFKRFGKALPIAGSVVGGMLGAGAGAVTGPLAVATAMGGAGLGAAAGESARQLIGRAIGEETPATSLDAAKEIGKEGGLGALGEGAGIGVGRAASAGFKAFPKVAHAFSGTPATNIARAQKRGLKVFAPGISREAAGKAQEQVEHPLVEKLFSPKERVLLRAKDAGYADTLQKSVMLKQERGLPITIKEAIGLRIMAPVKRAADTMRGLSKNIELDKAVRGARSTIAEKAPELTKRLGDTEKAITASQLRIPLRVNKTNPNQISGLTATMGPLLGIPALAATIPFSPLVMGLLGATMGQVKRSIPKVARRGIQRGGVQTLERALGNQ